MELWQIRGGRKLSGRCAVQGSKNAALPILAASVLAPRRIELFHVPQLRDVSASLEILRHLGCAVSAEGDRVQIDSQPLALCSIPRDLMLRQRSSVLFLGALLARCGEAKLCRPGGCRLGRRPIDMHLDALRQLGASIEEDDDEIICRPSRLVGARIELPYPSVGATENLMIAACAARGETQIRGAAREPEIVALQDFLRAMGAEIDGAGSGLIRIRGTEKRDLVQMKIPADRIVAASLCCAAASTGGLLELEQIESAQISTLLHFLNQAGCDIINQNSRLRISAPRRLQAVGPVITEPYPGFPTDAQPLLMAALLKSKGSSLIRETVFENRFAHVSELRRLGADIRVEGKTALIRGVDCLQGAVLTAADLRGGAALLIAGLGAQGDTVICDDGHISRGYERFDEVLRSLGADLLLETFNSDANT